MGYYNGVLKNYGSP